MKATKLFLTACLIGSVAFTSCDKDDEETLNTTDRDFIMKTQVSNTAEVDAGTLASTKATNTAVKSFAQGMIGEHSTAQADLKVLGANVGVSVKDSLDAPHVALRTQLAALSGRAFDSVYIWSQSADHAMTLTNFQTEIANGQHSDVVNYASKYLPHIQMHKVRADSIATAYFRR